MNALDYTARQCVLVPQSRRTTQHYEAVLRTPPVECALLVYCMDGKNQVFKKKTFRFRLQMIREI